MGSLVGSFRAMWYPDAGAAREPTPEVQEETRAELRRRDTELLEALQARLRKIESEAPGGLLQSEHHLSREKEKLRERIRRLEHEISILDD
jgi:hypothetical protein